MRLRRGRSYEDWDDVAEAYRTMRRRHRSRRLRRDTDRGMFGGVCAGIAKYLGIEPWIIRLVFIAIALSSGLVIPLVIYVVLVILLEPESLDDEDWVRRGDFENTESPYASIRSSPKLGLRVVSADVRELELRLRRVERYVTSPKYDLDKGFSDMAKY